MNEELISSAVSFLQDTTVAASPINKRIEFLQSKGLNEEEIDEAIKRANNPPADPSDQTKTTTATTYRGAISENQQTTQNFAPLDYYSAAPPLPERTWKDYFIMATATAGVTYGFYQVVSRYLLPSIIPPGRTRLDDDKQVIEEEFIKIDKVLEQMAIEQKEVKDANDAKLKDIDTVIENVNGFLQKYNTDKVKFDDDLKLMKLEVDNLQNSVEKNMRLTKESIHDELREIIEELDSLKSLIKVRGGATGVPERKVPPVSSIPSASEILKKAKSNGNSTSVPAKSPVDSSPVSEPSHSFSVTNSAESQPEKHRAPSFSAQKELHAAGIPDWQLAHKKKEEEESMEKSGDKKVQESISKVGVPQWQLNAS